MQVLQPGRVHVSWPSFLHPIELHPIELAGLLCDPLWGDLITSAPLVWRLGRGLAALCVTSCTCNARRERCRPLCRATHLGVHAGPTTPTGRTSSTARRRARASTSRDTRVPLAHRSSLRPVELSRVTTLRCVSFDQSVHSRPAEYASRTRSREAQAHGLGTHEPLTRTRFQKCFVDHDGDSDCDGLAGFQYSIVDKVQIPHSIAAGKYLLSWRWDCEQVPLTPAHSLFHRNSTFVLLRRHPTRQR